MANTLFLLLFRYESLVFLSEQPDLLITFQGAVVQLNIEQFVDALRRQSISGFAVYDVYRREITLVRYQVN